MSLVAHKYTPSEISEHELDATFAAREHTVDYLIKSLRDQSHAGTLSSFVVAGPRGAGKSTVIRMVALRIRRDPELSGAWLPVVFPEEQFSVTSLRDFLEAILRELSAGGISQAEAWLEKVGSEANDEQSQQLAITGLKEITRRAGRRLVVFVENLNLMLEECLDDQMKGTLRRLLMTDPFMMLIGSSVHVFDSLQNYDEAFFNYFGQVPLDRLNPEQVFELLKRRAKFEGNEQFLRDFPKQQPKIRAVVQLSGGNPRLILMLYEMLSRREVTTIVQCLRRLVDELTPLLKDEMENLPPQQRKVVHALMEKGGTAKPADLVAPTRLPLNAITVQLKRLKNAQVVELLGGGKGRAANYTVPDKLFSIWYQMRYLNRNRRRIELFVEVLRIWFEEEDRFATMQSLAKVENGASSGALREAALTTEYFAASLSDTPYASAARDQAVHQWLKSGDHREAALMYAELAGLRVREGIDRESAAEMVLGQWCVEHADVKTAREVLDPIIAETSRSAWERASALSYRAKSHYASGDIQAALADCTAILTMNGASKEQAAKALFNRAVAKRTLGDIHGELADYTELVALEGAPKEEVAMALINRGFAKGKQGDIQGELADYTTVTTLDAVPEQQVAMALFNRGVAKGRLGDIHAATADYTAVVTSKGASKEQASKALLNRGLSKGKLGDIGGAMADFTAVIELSGAPEQLVIMALCNRGVAKGMIGDSQGEDTDYTAVIAMADVPEEQVAVALLNRGNVRCKMGDTEGAMADFAAVLTLDGAPKEHVAKALVNRGAAKGTLGDTQGAIADFAAAATLEGAPQEQVGLALVNRGLANWKLGDIKGAMDDFTTVITLKGAAREQVAKALFNRALMFSQDRDTVKALDDLSAVMNFGATKENLLSSAAGMATMLVWNGNNREQVSAVLRKFSAATSRLPGETAREETLRFLSSLASPQMKEAWPFAWQTLAANPTPEVSAALDFFKPVCDILEGQDRSLLEALPPEQREFAQSVLARFQNGQQGSLQF